MIAITNSLPVKEGAADEIVERFAGSRGNVQDFPGFLAMEVLKSEDAPEVLVVTWWQDKEAFRNWVHSEEFTKAHGRGGAGELLTGHPKMTTYEVAVERRPAPSDRT
ncbi:MAG: antibiotic biosynthesis monooxygenase family protein [Rubrobacteraceae bacterium]